MFGKFNACDEKDKNTNNIAGTFYFFMDVYLS